MNCDVAIVGSGPSGSAAAHFLSSHGLKVICIERLGDDSFKKYHSTCGECISSGVAKIIDLQNEEIRNKISSFNLEWPSGVKTKVRIDGFIIDRHAVIKRLKHSAEGNGALFIRFSVVDINSNSSGFEVILNNGESIFCNYLIGADGAFSIVRKKIFDTSPELMIPVEMRIVDSKLPPSEITFGLVGKGKFYRWEFPSGDQSTVGAVKGNLEPGPGIHCGRVIPIGWIEKFTKGNCMLIGDAAGFVNPVSFGGLRIAFETAHHASEAIATGNIASYEKWWRKSPLSNKRFMNAMREFEKYDDNDYAQFAKHLNHGLWMSGIISVIANPKKTWLYIGCLMSLRYGW